MQLPESSPSVRPSEQQMLDLNTNNVFAKTKKWFAQLSRSIQKRQCLGCAGRETHAWVRCRRRSDHTHLHFSPFTPRCSGLPASSAEDFISQDAKGRDRPEGCVPSAGHDGGVGDFHHGGFHFGLHLQRCVFPQRQQQRRPRRCRAPSPGHWGLQPPPWAKLGATCGSLPGLSGRPEELVTRAAPAPGELLLPGAPTPLGWAPSLGAFRPTVPGQRSPV